MNDRMREAPVKVGDELDVKIEAVGEKGDGLARVGGFILFVSGVKEGDELRVRVTKVLQKVGFAEVVSSDLDKSVISEDSINKEEDESDESEFVKDSEKFGEE
ncbi:TRAM domain-containing protein [Candidatus Woesearchaeota archaeon]|nr:TRAM domain-containing protein [Candidatus Woesearchaeota archaeon]